MANITNCEECPLNKYKGEKLPVYRGRQVRFHVDYKEIPYRGNHNAEIVFIGESPGLIELAKEKAFWGDSGKDLRAVLKKENFDFDNDGFIMNACRCMWLKDKMATADENKALECCRPAVETALKIIKPKLIICLGAPAMRQVIRKKGITKKRGTVYNSEEFNCLVLPTYHPAYCMRAPQFKKYYIADIAQAIELKRNNFKIKDKSKEKNYRDVESIRDILDQKNITVAIDTETQGVDWTDPNSIIISYSVSTESGEGRNIWLHEQTEKDGNFTIQWPVKSGKKIELEERWIKRSNNYPQKIKELKELCKREDIKIIMMNGNYDIHRFYNLGITEINSYTLDVSTSFHALDPDGNKNAAQKQIFQVLFPGEPDYEAKHIINKEDMLSNDPKKHTDYACEDTDVTLTCGAEIKKRLLKDEKLANYYVNFVHPITTNVLFDIERNGIMFDVAGLEDAKKQAADIMKEKQNECLALLPRKIKADPKHKDKLLLTRKDLIRDTLFSDKGFKLKVLDDRNAITKTGLVAVGRDLLRRVQEETNNKKATDFIQHYIGWGPYQKLYSTYLKGFGNLVKLDGRLHGSISVTFTATGRTGMRKPALQTIPIKNKDIAAIIRRLLIAPKGKKLIAFDYNQSELRWIADRSGDPVMRKIFAKDGDMHIETAESVLKQKFDKLTKEERGEARDRAKPTNFGFIYGMSAQGFVAYARDNYGVIFTEDEAELYRKRYFIKYRLLPIWHEREKRFARDHGYCRTPYGRIRLMPNIDSDNYRLRGADEREAINTVIQSPSSDSALLAAYEAKKKGIIDNVHVKLVLFIHDELILEVDEDRVEDTAAAMKYEMCNLPTERFGFKLEVPLKADAKFGDNLAEMEKI